MSTTSNVRGCIALMVAHCAGMLDLVALPVWVGTLIQYFKLSPQQGGGLATLFLLGAVIASITLAPRFLRLNGRWVATAGFLLSAICFFAVSRTDAYVAMAVLHTIAGLSAGAALSVTHGTIARSPHPHRLFAIVGTALGIFSVVFLGSTPKLVAATGGSTLFVVFAGVMGVAALVSALAFPKPESSWAKLETSLDTSREESTAVVRQRRIPAPVWFGIVGITAMAMVQSMVFSFLERVGNAHGFGLEAITGVLIALGVVNLFPAPLAGVLEHRFSARIVMLIGPVLQAALALTIMNSTLFPPYAAACAVFAAVMIFTHTFVFGVLARLDTSGRAMAATPAMLMAGAAVGPLLGGTLVELAGYRSLGIAAVLIGSLSVLCFSRVCKPNVAGLAQEPAA